MAKSKLVRFLVVGIVVLVLSLSGGVFAQETSEPTWELVETLINPENKPTEFIVGVTPNYYSPRFDGSFNKYTIEETYFIHKCYWKDHVGTPSEFLEVDVEMRADFTKPPEILVPGEKITLNAKVSATGTSPGRGSGIIFEYRADGINLRDTTQVSTGSNSEPPFSTYSISPYFVVPETHSGEISIVAFLWNAGAVNVRWIYREQDSTPTDITPTPTDHTITTDEEECDTFCKEQEGSGWRGVLYDGGDTCACELTKEGCEDICQKADVRAHYEDIRSNKCYCSCDGKLREWNGKKCGCIRNAVPAEGDDCKCDSDSGYNLDVWGKKCEYVGGDENLDDAPELTDEERRKRVKEIPSASTYPAYNSTKNYCGPQHWEDRWGIHGPSSSLTSGADFNYACYEHDKCYGECKKTRNTQKHCDQVFRDMMDDSCDQAFDTQMKTCDAISGGISYKYYACIAMTRLQVSGCWTQAAINQGIAAMGGKVVGSYPCK